MCSCPGCHSRRRQPAQGAAVVMAGRQCCAWMECRSTGVYVAGGGEGALVLCLLCGGAMHSSMTMVDGRLCPMLYIVAYHAHPHPCREVCPACCSCTLLCRWRVVLQRLPNRHWVAVARGSPEAVVDAHGVGHSTAQCSAGQGTSGPHSTAHCSITRFDCGVVARWPC
jgi:hypothetical protein